MRLPTKYILNFRHIALAVCFVFWALNGAQAQTPDINKIWTTVGSAGTVDETDVSKVFFDHGVVQMGRPLVGSPHNYQVQSVSQCGPPTPPRFDFERKAYYIEATLTGSSFIGISAAGIQMIKVANNSRIG